MTAEEILKKYGLKTTRQRSNIIGVLIGAELPMCAEDIFRAAGDMSLSTVYRTLELFCECRVIKKISIANSEKMYYELTDGKHRHYAVCLECGRLAHVDVCPVHDASVNGFTVTGHRLELYGYCEKCEKKQQ